MRLSFAHHRSIALGAALALALLSLTPAHAQAPTEPMEEPAPMAEPAAPALTVDSTHLELPPGPELVVEEGAVRLLLEDAIALALRRNLDIAVERYNRRQSLLGIRQARGLYDLRLSLDASLENSDSPATARVEGVAVLTSDSRDATFSVAQLTPFGGEAAFSLFGLRESSNSENNILDPQYFSQGNVRFSQPLLRDLGYAATNRDVIVARLNSDINLEFFEQQVSDVVEQVEAAYWRLVEAREQLVVAQDALELADDLHRRNRIQVEVGTLAPIELVQSEATIAQRQEDIIRTEAALGDAIDELLRLLNLPDTMAEGLDVVPLTDPETERLEVDVDGAIRMALAERPVVRTQRLAVQQLEVDSRVAANAKLPRADLVVNYGASAIGGSGNVDLGEGQVLNVDSDLREVIGDVFSREFTGWSVGVTVAYPLQNRSARAASAIADLELEQARTELSRLELNVVTEVRSAARRVRTAAQQIESARSTRRLQERNLEAEQKRYENGMSDSFRIAQIQTDLTEAASREVTAVTNYRVALSSYHRAVGRLLESHGVELLGPGQQYRPEERPAYLSFLD